MKVNKLVETLLTYTSYRSTSRTGDGEVGADAQQARTLENFGAHSSPHIRSATLRLLPYLDMYINVLNSQLIFANYQKATGTYATARAAAQRAAETTQEAKSISAKQNTQSPATVRLDRQYPGPGPSVSPPEYPKSRSAALLARPPSREELGLGSLLFWLPEEVRYFLELIRRILCIILWVQTTVPRKHNIDHSKQPYYNPKHDQDTYYADFLRLMCLDEITLWDRLGATGLENVCSGFSGFDAINAASRFLRWSDSVFKEDTWKIHEDRVQADNGGQIDQSRLAFREPAFQVEDLLTTKGRKGKPVAFAFMKVCGAGDPPCQQANKLSDNRCKGEGCAAPLPKTEVGEPVDDDLIKVKAVTTDKKEFDVYLPTDEKTSNHMERLVNTLLTTTRRSKLFRSHQSGVDPLIWSAQGGVWELWDYEVHPNLHRRETVISEWVEKLCTKLGIKDTFMTKVMSTIYLPFLTANSIEEIAKNFFIKKVDETFGELIPKAVVDLCFHHMRLTLVGMCMGLINICRDDTNAAQVAIARANEMQAQRVQDSCGNGSQAPLHPPYFVSQVTNLINNTWATSPKCIHIYESYLREKNTTLEMTITLLEIMNEDIKFQSKSTEDISKILKKEMVQHLYTKFGIELGPWKKDLNLRLLDDIIRPLQAQKDLGDMMSKAQEQRPIKRGRISSPLTRESDGDTLGLDEIASEKIPEFRKRAKLSLPDLHTFCSEDSGVFKEGEIVYYIGKDKPLERTQYGISHWWHGEEVKLKKQHTQVEVVDKKNDEFVKAMKRALIDPRNLLFHQKRVDNQLSNDKVLTKFDGFFSLCSSCDLSRHLPHTDEENKKSRKSIEIVHEAMGDVTNVANVLRWKLP